jgi:hypothetical protein
LETARSWDQRAADARAEATMLRRRAAAPRLHEQLMRLRGWPSPVVAIRGTPRGRERRPSRANRRTATATRTGPSEPSDEPPPPLGGIPRIEFVQELEGRLRARLVCATFEEELRLRAELVRWRGGGMTRCPTRKRPYDAETAVDEGCRLRLRAYRCPRCGSFHLSSKRKVRARIAKRSPAEVGRVWAL